MGVENAGFTALGFRIQALDPTSLAKGHPDPGLEGSGLEKVETGHKAKHVVTLEVSGLGSGVHVATVEALGVVFQV